MLYILYLPLRLVYFLMVSGLPAAGSPPAPPWITQGHVFEAESRSDLQKNKNACLFCRCHFEDKKAPAGASSRSIGFLRENRHMSLVATDHIFLVAREHLFIAAAQHMSLVATQHMSFVATHHMSLLATRHMSLLATEHMSLVATQHNTLNVSKNVCFGSPWLRLG